MAKSSRTIGVRKIEMALGPPWEPVVATSDRQRDRARLCRCKLYARLLAAGASNEDLHEVRKLRLAGEIFRRWKDIESPSPHPPPVKRYIRKPWLGDWASQI